MGLNILGPKKTRQLSRQLGFPVDRIVVFSHHMWWMVHFRIDDIHKHGWMNRRTGEWAWEECPHWTSCRELVS